MRRMSSFLVRLIAIGTLLGLLGVPASAASITWDGGGASNNITTLANWDPDTALPGSTDDVHFAGVQDPTPVVDIDATFKTITFDANAGAFTIGGTSKLTLAQATSSLTPVLNNLSTNTQTFDCPVSLAGPTSLYPNQNLAVAATAGDIVFNGPVFTGLVGAGNTTGARVWMGGAHNVYLNGEVQSNAPTYTGIDFFWGATGSASVDPPATGTLFITGSNPGWDPLLRINQGTVRLNNTNNFGSSTKRLEWATGAGYRSNSKLELDGSGGNIDLYKPLTISNHSIENVQLVSLAGDNTLYGEITLVATNTATNSSSYFGFQVDSGTLTISSANFKFDNYTRAYNQNIRLLGAGNGVFNPSIPTYSTTYKSTLTKDGSGTWTLYNVQYYNGNTTILGGTLALGAYASIDTSPAISVADGATFDVSARTEGYYLAVAGQNQSLGGSGTVKGLITAGTYGLLYPGGLNAAGTLTFDNPGNLALDLQTGATLDYNFTSETTPGGGVNDLLQVNGNLAISGSTSVVLHMTDGYLASGNYRMIAYTGTFTGSTASLSLVGAPVTRQNPTFVNDTVNKYINLNLVGNSADLVWKGGAGGNPNAWDLNTTANFLNGAVMDKFFDLDDVLFDDTGSAYPSVMLSGTLQPNSITVNSTANYTFGGTGKISGITGLVKQGTGKLTLANSGTNDFSGTVTIGGGTLQLGDGATFYAGLIGAGNVVNNGALVLDVPDDRTLANRISGTGSIEKKNSYLSPVTVTLTGNNSYTGVTTVSSGTLRAGSNTAFGSTSAGTVVLPGATLDSGGFNLGLEHVTISGTGVYNLGAFVNSGASQLYTLRYLTLAADASVGGNARWDLRYATGAPVLDLAGHTMTYVGSNTSYVVNGNVTDGNITVNSGTFGFVRSTVTGTGTLTANLGGTLEVYEITNPANFTRNIILGGGGLRSNGAAGTVSTINSNVSLTADSTIETLRNLTLQGAVTGNFKVTKAGDGSLILPAANAQWTGGTVISAGTLQIGIGGTAGTLPAGTISGDYSGMLAALAVNRSDSVNVSNLLTGAIGFTQMGTGTTTLSNSANDYSGITTIANGVFQVTHDKGLGDAAGATSIAGYTVSPRLELIGSGGGLTLGDQLLLAGHATSAQPHVLNVSGTNTWNGAVDMTDQGGWNFVLASASGKLTVTGDVTNRIPVPTPITTTTTRVQRYLDLTGAANGEISGIISSDYSVTAAPLHVHKMGTGTWTLSGVNAYTGDTVVQAGTLKIGATGSIATSPRIEIQGNATLDVSAFAAFTLAENQTLTGGAGANASIVIGSIMDATGASILPGGQSTVGTLAISGNLTLTGSGKTTFELGAATTVGNGVNDLLMVGGNVNVNAPMSLEVIPSAPLATGSYRLMNYGGTLSNPGNLSLNNSTRYAMTLNTATAGQVNVAVSGSAANLVWVGDGAGNAWDVNGTVNWSNGGSPDKFYQGDVVTFNATSANNTVNIGAAVSPMGTITVTGSSDYTFDGSGSIVGPAGIAKSGSGALTVNTANDFAGTVTVTDGILKLGNNKALGSTTGGTVVSGTGTLDLNDYDYANNPRELPQEEVITISGAGYNGQGAIVNTAGEDNAAIYYTNHVKKIVMADNAAIGGTVRWQMKDSPGGFQGNGYTLTKVGSNLIVLDDLGDTGLGDINVNEGTLAIYNNTTMGLPGKTVTIANGATLQLYWNPDGLVHNKKLAVAPSGGEVYVTLGSPIYAGDATLSGVATMNINDNRSLTFQGNITGSGGLTKAGLGDLILTGNNSYTGVTTLSSGRDANDNPGTVILDSPSGYAIPGNVVFTTSSRIHLNRGEENGGQPQVSPSTVITFSDTVGWQYLELSGHSITLEGLEMTNYATASALIASVDNSNSLDPLAVGVLTINSQHDHQFAGMLRDNGSPLALVKRGPGTQTLSGTQSGSYTGGLTVMEGTLDYSAGALPATTYTITGGNLKIGDRSRTIGQFQITGGLVEATTGRLTSSLDFDIQGGTVQAELAGTTAMVGLDKSGAGTATLTGNLLYTGNTTVYDGTLNATAINTPAATVWVGTGGTLNASSIMADTLTIGGNPTAASAAVPEPGTLALLALAGLAALGAFLRRR